MSVAAAPPGPAGQAEAPPAQPTEGCPLCGSPLGAEQEWCLRCGAAARTRLASTPNWRAPLVLLGGIIVLGLGVLTAALVSLAGGSGSAPGTTITRTVTAPASTPGATTPGTTTPGATTPGTTTPGTTTPGASTPGSTVPGATTPGTSTPGASTPGGLTGTTPGGAIAPRTGAGTGAAKTTPGATTPTASTPQTTTTGAARTVTLPSGQTVTVPAGKTIPSILLPQPRK